MANRFRGQIAASFQDQEFTLVLDWNALAEFESMTDKNAMEVIQGASAKKPMSFSDSRALVLAAMRRHHPDATADDAGDLLSEDMTLVNALLIAATPDAQVAPGNGKAPAAKKPPARR